MASLNTLRTKGGWFLTIVIVLALLAFIMGDAFSGQGRKNPVVGVINGEKVTYTDFLNERTRQQEMIQGAGEEAQEQAYAQAWSELVNQNALMPGFETLGLGLSEEEQKDMTSGVGGGYISPVIEQYFRNPETGAFDPAVLAYFIGNMTEREHAAWQMIKKQANDERLFSKYGNLVAAGLFINDLELNAAVEAENAAYDARVVFKPYSSIVDSTVTVPASELKAYYNSHKEKYRRGASREVEYVVFDILPSADDMEEGRKHVEELAAQFAAAADPAQFAALNSDDKTPATFVREDAVAVPLDGAPVLEGETYTMSRLAERRMLPDSVTFGAIILAQGREQLADSLMNVANGSNFPRLTKKQTRKLRY